MRIYASDIDSARQILPATTFYDCHTGIYAIFPHKDEERFRHLEVMRAVKQQEAKSRVLVFLRG